MSIEVPTDAELAGELGFRSQHAEANATRLHYVAGGEGDPLLLLPGWPHTWWSFHKIMGPLAARHRVIAVDLRGMGGSAKPEQGYAKKTMAADIAKLADQLGHDRLDVIGHDIGSMVAYALAANHPERVRRLVFLDVFHPDESFTEMRLLPQPGQAVNPDENGRRDYLWWFVFNQVRGLPERLLAGRMSELVRWLWHYEAVNQQAMTERDLAIYADRYDSPEAIRAGNAWYQTFPQDITDAAEYPLLSTPTLGIPGAHTHESLRQSLARHFTGFDYAPVPTSGHYLAEERPEAVVDEMSRFLA